jgi:DNA repair exonuclease SbcCD ATPase subunit
VTAARGQPELLRAARRQDCLTKRQRVLTTLEQMERDREPVTFAAVARAANVSTWLVYAEGVREHIDAARQRQITQPLCDQRAGSSASAASLRTDLALARQEITELRLERDKLRGNLRKQLGRQLDALTHRELIDRIDELTRDNQRLNDLNHQLITDNQQLHQQVTDLEDDLAAARTSLRRMIHDINQPPENP